MITTPSSFTYDLLSSLKFKELQKLSAQFHVNKRWAKKQELIENLLALKENYGKTENYCQDEENEWRDGSTVFRDLKQNNETEVNQRLTFNVNKRCKAEHTEPHLTFEISQNGKNLFSEVSSSRETYDIPSNRTDFAIELLTNSRATFEIPPKKPLVNEEDPRATFNISQNGKNLLEESQMNLNLNFIEQNSSNKKLEMNLNEVDISGVTKDLEKIGFDINIKNEKKGKVEKTKPQMKMLTIPYARITRRTKMNSEASKTDNSPMKMSKRSINIKKSSRLPVSKNDLIKSPAFSSVKKPINKQTVIQGLIKPQSEKIVQSKVQLNFTKEKSQQNEAVHDSNKENVKKILRKVSRTIDEEKKSSLARVNFKTPPPSIIKSSKTMPLKKTPLRKDEGGRLSSHGLQTLGCKPTVKPLTITKMPDFNKIHKKQFEQMDSLHDYLKKKEERIRKLFGTPQPGQQCHALRKSAPIFHFQSTSEKGNKSGETLKSAVTPLKRRENDPKSAQKEAFKNKLPPMKVRSDIKDKNRSLINGVRTNKRFELQMKFRNL